MQQADSAAELKGGGGNEGRRWARRGEERRGEGRVVSLLPSPHNPSPTLLHVKAPSPPSFLMQAVSRRALIPPGPCTSSAVSSVMCATPTTSRTRRRAEAEAGVEPSGVLPRGIWWRAYG